VFPRCGEGELTFQIGAVNDRTAFGIAFLRSAYLRACAQPDRLTSLSCPSLRREAEAARSVSRRRGHARRGSLAFCSTAGQTLLSRLRVTSDGNLTRSCHPSAAKPKAWPLALLPTGRICGIRGRWQCVWNLRFFFQGSRIVGRNARDLADGSEWPPMQALVSYLRRSPCPRQLEDFDLAGLGTGW